MPRSNLQNYAEELAYTLFTTMFNRIYESGNETFPFRNDKEEFKSVSKIVSDNYKDIEENRHSPLNDYKNEAYHATEEFFGVNCRSRDVDDFVEFAAHHSLKELHDRNSFIHNIDVAGRKIVCVSKYMGVSESWSKWLYGFSDRMVLDPFTFGSQLDIFEKDIDQFLNWTRAFSNYDVERSLKDIHTFIKMVISGSNKI